METLFSFLFRGPTDLDQTYPLGSIFFRTGTRPLPGSYADTTLFSERKSGGDGCVPGLFTTLALLFREVTLFVAYIKNNAFPQPLKEKEEEKYLKEMAAGDKKARNALIEHNLRLVAHIVKKFENTSEDNEDLISIGTIGLIKAIESYRPNKGTKLATYAARCIENEILMSIVVLLKCMDLHPILIHQDFPNHMTNQFFLVLER